MNDVQFDVLCDDGESVAIYAKTPEEALQTAREHMYRPCEAVLCEEEQLVQQAQWAQLLEEVS